MATDIQQMPSFYNQTCMFIQQGCAKILIHLTIMIISFLISFITTSNIDQSCEKTTSSSAPVDVTNLLSTKLSKLSSIINIKAPPAVRADVWLRFGFNSIKKKVTSQLCISFIRISGCIVLLKMAVLCQMFLFVLHSHCIHVQSEGTCSFHRFRK